MVTGSIILLMKDHYNTRNLSLKIVIALTKETKPSEASVFLLNRVCRSPVDFDQWRQELEQFGNISKGLLTAQLLRPHLGL